MKTAQRLFPNYLTGFLVLLGVGLLIYPQAAAWFAQLNQTELTVEYNKAIENAVPNAREQLVAARAYNDALTTGTLIPANERLPRLAGESSDTVEVNGRTWTYGAPADSQNRRRSSRLSRNFGRNPAQRRRPPGRHGPAGRRSFNPVRYHRPSRISRGHHVHESGQSGTR